MAELGQTQDPKRLVPGDSAQVRATVSSLRHRGDEMEMAGRGLQRIDTADGWSGDAANAFRAVFKDQPTDWLKAGDSFRDAADALETYAKTLTWAQGEADRAITAWNEAEAATQNAQAQYQHYHDAGGTEPFQDPGENARAGAQQVLNSARSQLEQAGDAAASKIGAARDLAPAKKSFWDKVKGVGSDVGADLENAGAHVVNGLASFGNAVVEHPGATATSAAGVGLMLLGAAGDVGGTLLAGTVVLAPVGAAIDVGSTGLIVTGGAITAGAVGDLTMHAVGDDHVSPLSSDHTGSGGGSGGNYTPSTDLPDAMLDDTTEPYVNGKHVDGGPNVTSDKSTFDAGVDLDDLVEKGNAVDASGPSSTGNYERDVNAGKIIGKTSADSGSRTTTWYRVVQDKYGNVITMHPIPAP